LLDLDETLIHSEDFKPGEDYDFVIELIEPNAYGGRKDVKLHLNNLNFILFYPNKFLESRHFRKTSLHRIFTVNEPDLRSSDLHSQSLGLC
jgi:hypothetical protein